MRLKQQPDWRWIRARRLADNGLTPSRSRDDRLTQKAFKFVKRLRKLDIKAEERLYNDYPEIYEAFKIYDDPQSGTRWVFEASIMARKTIEEMSDYLRVDVKVLETYEGLFFDVREALDNPGWILSNILMPATTGNVSHKDPDVFWKYIAYHGGWEAIRSSWEIGHASAAAIDFFNKANRNRIIKNAFDAAHTLQIHSMNANDTVKSAQDQRRLDHDTETPASGDAVHESLGVLLESLSQMTVTPAKAQLAQEEPRLQQLPEPVTIDVTPTKKK